jgi:hypothetical protein
LWLWWLVDDGTPPLQATRYFDVEARFADVSPDCLVLTPERAKPLIDENTIGVCPILGSTYVSAPCTLTDAVGTNSAPPVSWQDGTFEDVEGEGHLFARYGSFQIEWY